MRLIAIDKLGRDCPTCRMVEEVVADLGGLHIAVNNAGVNRNHAAEECSEDDWDTTFGLNTKATFLCCQAEGRHMLAQGATFASCSRISHATLHLHSSE